MYRLNTYLVVGVIGPLLLLGRCSLSVAAEIVYETDFDSAAALDDWIGIDSTGVGLLPGLQGTKSLSVQIPNNLSRNHGERLPRAEISRNSENFRIGSKKDGPGHRNAQIKLPLEKLRGTKVRVEATVRAEDVSEPPNAWNGIEVMLHTTGPDGPKWQQQNSVFGTFDWKTVRFLVTVPADATEATLVLGLESVTGRVWFDNVRVTVVSRRRSADGPAKLGPYYKGHDLPRLRGVMIGRQVAEDDLRELGGQWKANHVRWQLIWGGFPHGPADNGDLEAYHAWIESELKRLDSLLPVCREVGIQVLIDLHTPPGGRNQAKECQLFKEARFQQAFIEVWEKIATRYRGNKTVWGYDLVNEPVEGMLGDGMLDWHALAAKTARRVRQIDPDHAIILEPAPWGSPESLEFFEPIDLDRVVYSVHMYKPHQFTHQGVHDDKTGIVYPGEIDGRSWNKETLRQALKPALEYQRDYGVHIYIGEFSAIRWAPGTSAHDYLRDVIAIMEEYDWDWAYHAFREWDGWSVEHGPDRNNRHPTAEPTDRQKLLTDYFQKNQRP